MTPKTQSVCKHCHKPIKCTKRFASDWEDEYGVFCSALGGLKYHEPVAEPASTGEPPRPPITEMYLCETERLFLKPNQLYRFVIHPTCVRCQELELITAARPSEPSAPQTSADPQLCQECGDPEGAILHMLEPDYPTYERHIWFDKGEDYTVQVMRVAAPGSVPQAPMCKCPYAKDQSKEWHLVGSLGCMGVPQAEPPK